MHGGVVRLAHGRFCIAGVRHSAQTEGFATVTAAGTSTTAEFSMVTFSHCLLDEAERGKVTHAHKTTWWAATERSRSP